MVLGGINVVNTRAGAAKNPGGGGAPESSVPVQPIPKATSSKVGGGILTENMGNILVSSTTATTSNNLQHQGKGGMAGGAGAAGVGVGLGGFSRAAAAAGGKGAGVGFGGRRGGGATAPGKGARLGGGGGGALQPRGNPTGGGVIALSSAGPLPHCTIGGGVGNYTMAGGGGGGGGAGMGVTARGGLLAAASAAFASSSGAPILSQRAGGVGQPTNLLGRVNTRRAAAAALAAAAAASNVVASNTNKVASRRPFMGNKLAEIHGAAPAKSSAAVHPPRTYVAAATGYENLKTTTTAPSAVAKVVSSKPQDENDVGYLPDQEEDSNLTQELDDEENVDLEKLEVIENEDRQLPGLMSGLAIRDIDAFDDNPQLVPEYINEITDYLFRLERNFDIKEKYLDGTQLNGRMRSVLLDWLVQVHLQFGFKAETLYITSSVLDRFLSLDRTIPRQQLQLVGVTATYIAVKYEEISVPCLNDFSAVSDGAFTTKELLAMECRMLKTLKFDMSSPIPAFFLRRCSKAAAADITIHTLAKYVLELALLEYCAVHIRPSLLAAGALGLSLMIIKKKSLGLLWNPTIAYYSRYSINDIKPIIKTLSNILAAAYEENGKLQGVRKKFSNSKLYRISAIPDVNPVNWKLWLLSAMNH